MDLAIEVDGRTARRDRNRQAVLDAMIELFSEDVDPGPDEVAARSGLSPRSVYRYFEDRDGLVRAAIERKLTQVAPLFEVVHLGEGPLDTRVAVLVARRVALFDAVRDTARAARHRAERVGVIAEQVQRSREALADQVARQFAPELGALDALTRRRTLAALDALCQFESIDYLRHGRALSAAQVRDVLASAITSLLTRR